MASKHAGRLELTWTDKDKTLLSTGDGQYDYTFVDPSDYRVSEVRLLHEVERVEAVTPEDRPEGLPEPTDDNLLITGDAMHVLDALAKIPEYSEKYLGQIRLCYIDPPFNTGQAFEQYEDNIEHSIWLTMLRDRLKQIKPLLRQDGSVWVHLDDVEVHRCRVVLDEEFGPHNFVAEVSWQKAVTPRNNTTKMTATVDTILVYRVSDRWRLNRLDRLALSNSRHKSQDGDPVPWRDNPTDAPGAASHQGMVYAIQHPITGRLMYTKVGRCWGREQSWFLEQMQEYAPYELREIDDAERRAKICGTTPDKVRKGVQAIMLAVPLEEAAKQAQARYDAGIWPTVYLTRKARGGIQLKAHQTDIGRVPATFWPSSEVGANIDGKSEIQDMFPDVTPFATPKPERLLKRIIEIASDPGDIILDCYAGSGTTAAAAQKLGRRWVTSELISGTVSTFTKPRLTRVVKGDDPGGITAETIRVAADGVELPSGVAPEDAQEFNRVLNKLADNGDPIEIDLRIELAKMVRASKKSDDPPLSNDDANLLLRLLKTFAVQGASFDVTKSAKSQLAMRTKTRDQTTTLWHGGGGFTHLEVGPSMFEEVEGMVLLADWATQGDLAEAMCAQLEASYSPDGIFAAKEGTVRYVVVDGLVGESTIRSILDQLPEGQIVEVWATQYTDSAPDLLRKERKGSRLEAIPDSVLDRYRRKASNGSPFKKEKTRE